MSWWLRLRRLWGQDRIRLSPRDVRPPRVRVGDHLEIYGRLWTVEADLSSDPEARRAEDVAYRLVDDGGPTRRVILRRAGSPRHGTAFRGPAHRGPARQTPWVLEDEAGRRRVCWRDVIQYGVRPDLRRDPV